MEAAKVEAARLEAEKAAWAKEEEEARLAVQKAAEDEARLEAERKAAEEAAAVEPEEAETTDSAALTWEEASAGVDKKPSTSKATGLAAKLAGNNGASSSTERPAAVALPLLKRMKQAAAASVQELPSPRSPQRVVLADADDVMMTLTARPSVRTARGLEIALEDAKEQAGPRPNETIKKLVDAAAEKLEETRDEIRRCAEVREARLSAFRACAAVGDSLREIFDILISDAEAGGPQRDDFFNLHLCLAREGFFGSEKAGTLLATYPFAYASPVWYRYAKSGFSGDSGDSQGEFTEPDQLTAKANAEAVVNDLRTFGDGVKLWRTLLAGDHVEKGLLTFEGLEAMAFELADAALTHKHQPLLKPFGGDARTSLQAYLDVVFELRKSIVKVPSPEDDAPTPNQARRRTVSGAGDGASLLRAVVDKATEKATDGRRASHQPSPSTAGGGWKGLASVLKKEGAAAFGATLKHTWPHPEAHASEMNRRITLLKLALSRDEPITKASVAKEFREYCRAVGRGKAKQLSYYDIDRAWRRMQDKNYIDLTFRYEVASRVAISHGCSEILNDAQHADEEQTMCFVKLIDLDCDGVISEDDFAKAMTSSKLLDSISKLRDKWQSAALALERE